MRRGVKKLYKMQLLPLYINFEVLVPRLVNFFVLNSTEHEIFPAYKC